jgi:dTMP kinase
VLGGEEVRELSLWATEGLLPHVTILLDLDEATGKERLAEARTKYDRLEAEEAEFHGRAREAYLALAAAEPGRFLVVDATRPVDEIAEVIRDRVAPLL